MDMDTIVDFQQMLHDEIWPEVSRSLERSCYMIVGDDVKKNSILRLLLQMTHEFFQYYTKKNLLLVLKL